MMPTYEGSRRFGRDFQKLTSEQRKRFMALLATDFIPALKTQQFPPRLRIKRVQATAQVWELTWAPDGRATFQYGAERSPGEPHVIWRRIGTHAIFEDP
jgi:hypothetical protein